MRNWDLWVDMIKARAGLPPAPLEAEESIRTYAAMLPDYLRRDLPDVLYVRAVRLSLTNIRGAAGWIKAQRGAVCGMNYRETGDLAERGIRLGDWEGKVETFAVGDWVVETGPAMFRCYPNRVFARMFQRVYGPQLPTDVVPASDMIEPLPVEYIVE